MMEIFLYLFLFTNAEIASNFTLYVMCLIFHNSIINYVITIVNKTYFTRGLIQLARYAQVSEKYLMRQLYDY